MAAIILDDPYAYVVRHYMSTRADSTSTSGITICISPTAVATNYRASNWEILFAPYDQEAILPIRSAEDFIRRQKQRKRHVFNKEPKVTNENVVCQTQKQVPHTIRQPRIERGQKRRMYCQKIRKSHHV